MSNRVATDDVPAAHDVVVIVPARLGGDDVRPDRVDHDRNLGFI